VDGLIIPFNTWIETLPYVDIGIFATSAPDTLLDRNLIEEHLGKRPRRPLFLIDLAVPRDINRDVSELQNVYLYDLADLAEIANENLRSREQEVETCLQELEQKASYMWEKLRL
jgi:glutamyl-tRNA reductase